MTNKKQRVKKKYANPLREIAMERLKSCENVTALSEGTRGSSNAAVQVA